MLPLGLWLPSGLPAGEVAGLLLGLAAHHDEIVDPDFLAWLKARLDHLISLDPWVLVVILTVIVLSIPATIVGFYVYQQWRLRYS